MEKPGREFYKLSHLERTLFNLVSSCRLCSVLQIVNFRELSPMLGWALETELMDSILCAVPSFPVFLGVEARPQAC